MDVMICLARFLKWGKHEVDRVLQYWQVSRRRKEENNDLEKE